MEIFNFVISLALLLLGIFIILWLCGIVFMALVKVAAGIIALIFIANFISLFAD